MDSYEGDEIVVTARIAESGGGGGWGGGFGGGYGGDFGGFFGAGFGGGAGYQDPFGPDEFEFQPEEDPGAAEPLPEEVVVTADPLPYTEGWEGDQFIVRAYDFANGQIHVGSVSDTGIFVGEQPMTPEAVWDALPTMIWPGSYEQIA